MVDEMFTNANVGERLPDHLRGMLRSLLHRLLLLVALLGAPVFVHAQEEGLSRKKQEKLLAKKERDDAKEVKKEEKRIAKKHLENQDKATRKRMKRNKKRADRSGQNPHRDPWPRRWFTR
jgi:hypothetical protein